jgi:hypothetical protein
VRSVYSDVEGYIISGDLWRGRATCAVAGRKGNLVGGVDLSSFSWIFTFKKHKWHIIDLAKTAGSFYRECMTKFWGPEGDVRALIDL